MYMCYHPEVLLTQLLLNLCCLYGTQLRLVKLHLASTAVSTAPCSAPGTLTAAPRLYASHSGQRTSNEQHPSLQSGSLTGRDWHCKLPGFYLKLGLAQVSEGGSLDFSYPAQSESPSGLQFE